MNRIIYILTLLSVALPLAAQEPGKTVALPFSAFPLKVRDLAMGGAAVQEFIPSTHISATGGLYAPQGDKAFYTVLDGEYAMSEHLSFTLCGAYTSFQKYTIIDESGYSKGLHTPVNFRIHAGCGYRITDILSIKARVGYIAENLAPESLAGALSTDFIGIADLPVSTSSTVTVLAGIYNLGTKVKSASGNSFSIPSSARIGARYMDRIIDKSLIELRLEADYYLYGAVSAAAGAAYTYDEKYSFRAGYRYGDGLVIPSFWSVGLGIVIRGINLDISYLMGNKAINNTACISLGYTF